MALGVGYYLCSETGQLCDFGQARLWDLVEKNDSAQGSDWHMMGDGGLLVPSFPTSGHGIYQCPGVRFSLSLIWLTVQAQCLSGTARLPIQLALASREPLCSH